MKNKKMTDFNWKISGVSHIHLKSIFFQLQSYLKEFVFSFGCYWINKNITMHNVISVCLHYDDNGFFCLLHFRICYKIEKGHGDL